MSSLSQSQFCPWRQKFHKIMAGKGSRWQGRGLRGESVRQYNPLPSGSVDKESGGGSRIKPDIFQKGEDLPR